MNTHEIKDTARQERAAQMTTQIKDNAEVRRLWLTCDDIEPFTPSRLPAREGKQRAGERLRRLPRFVVGLVLAR